jgi:hypothetical protein
MKKTWKVRFCHDGWMLLIRNNILAVAIIPEKCSKWCICILGNTFPFRTDDDDKKKLTSC